MRKILFIFILMILVVPLNVIGEEKESAMGSTYSVTGGKSVFTFGDGHYLKIPFDVVIKSKDFDVLKIIETDIELSKLSAKCSFDLEKDNNTTSDFTIFYKDITIFVPVSINIPYYIDIPEIITVSSVDFDVWNYIDTNISNKKDIEIVGNYDLSVNDNYEIIINYKDISKKVIVSVDIDENNIITDTESNDKEENTCPLVKENITYETKNYVSNYYTYNTEEVSNSACEKIEIPTPINKTIYNNTNSISKMFPYVSYVFYGLVIILLSINVVRKK